MVKNIFKKSNLMFVWGELQNKTLLSRIVSLNLNWLLIVCIQFGKLGYLQFALTACLVAGVWGRGAGVTVISLSSVRRLAAGAGAKYSVSCATFYDAALSNNFLRESGESPVRQRLILDHWQFLHLQSYNSDDITDKVWAVAQLFKSLFLVSFR